MISEQRNPASIGLDLLNTQELVQIINQQDQQVAVAVASQQQAICKAIDLAVNRLSNRGRLIYLGAGTSGRLGVLDAVECWPTFSVGNSQIIAIIAGGDAALTQAVEGAEDNEQLAIDDLTSINFSSLDVLVGIAASGNTPYVRSALRYANQLEAATIALSCNPEGCIHQFADVVICPVVGPEVLTGSTRMKAGSAQKLVLNTLSTSIMIKLGKVYDNLMVDVQATNTKLKQRAKRIFMEITTLDEQAAEMYLKRADGNTKLAILMAKRQLSAEQATALLENSGGKLRLALDAVDRRRSACP